MRWKGPRMWESPGEVLEGGDVIPQIPPPWRRHAIVMPHVHALVLRARCTPAAAGRQG